MGFIRHCQHWRKASSYWLFPDEQKFVHTILHILEACPRCRQTVFEVQHIDTYGRKTPQHRIRLDDQQAWRDKLKRDMEYSEPDQKAGFKESRPTVYVSEFSNEVSRDTGAVFDRTLQRLEGKPSYQDMIAQPKKPVAGSHNPMQDQPEP